MTTEERKRTLNHRPPPFPEDFGERLEGLKELSGLSWGEFAERLSVTQRGLAKWRKGCGRGLRSAPGGPLNCAVCS